MDLQKVLVHRRGYLSVFSEYVAVIKLNAILDEKSHNFSCRKYPFFSIL